MEITRGELSARRADLKEQLGALETAYQQIIGKVNMIDELIAKLDKVPAQEPAPSPEKV